MELLGDLWGEFWAVLTTLFAAAPYIIGYVLIILLMMVIWNGVKRLLTPKHDYSSLKTVTFGDESAVTSNTVASVVSIVLIFVLWGAFTGSKLLPGFMHAPGPFEGQGSFEYTITTPRMGTVTQPRSASWYIQQAKTLQHPRLHPVMALPRTTLLQSQCIAVNCCGWTATTRWAATKRHSSPPSMANRLRRAAVSLSALARVAMSDKGHVEHHSGNGHADGTHLAAIPRGGLEPLG